MSGKNKGGAPLKYKTPEEMQDKIEEYFQQCSDKEVCPGVAGMSYYLGFADRSSVTNYKNYPKFSHTIKRGLFFVEVCLEEWLSSGKNIAGIIFNLKNNYGWVDKQEVEQSGTVKVIGVVEEWKDE